VHVDRSVVPDEYLEFASRYPICINGKIKNILKSQISKNLVSRNDNYKGRVVVKTDLNSAGWPERAANMNILSLVLLKIIHRIGVPTRKFISQLDYKVYDSSLDVPNHYFDNADFVVEKFLPEMYGELFCLNSYYFLGDMHSGIKIYSRNPIVNGSVQVKREYSTPHPEIINIRNQLGIDYGKLDYCVVNGKAVLLDLNKTNAVAMHRIAHEHLELIHKQAAGIYYYF
jgi:hypothetical protein